MAITMPPPRGPSARGLVRRALRCAPLAAALVACLGVLPSAARGAGFSLKGKIVGGGALLNPGWNEARDPKLFRFTFREPSATVRPDARALSGYLPKELCIVALGDGAAPPAKAPRKLLIAGGRTTPVTIVVPAGQLIQLENQDPFPHRIYEVGGKGLAAADIAPAGSRSFTPPGPGRYELRDQTTPSLRSWIVVEPKAAAITYPDRKGEFAIDLEPGSYRLRGYFAGEPVGHELAVTVEERGDPVLKSPLVVSEPGKPGGGR